MQSKKGFSFIILPIVVIVFALAFGAIFYLNPQVIETIKKCCEKTIHPTVKVTVGLKWLHQAQFAGMYVADQKGFYKEEGLDVDLQEYDFGADNINRLVDGEFDFIVSSPIETLIDIGTGRDIKILAAIYQISPHSVAMLEDSKINSPYDFADKTLANKGDSHQGAVLYSSLLSAAGIDEKDVDFVTPGFETTELEDLQSEVADAIDLYRTDQLYHFEQQGVNYKLIKSEDYGISPYDDVIVSKSSFVEENPDLVGKFIRATIKGWDYAIKNPDEAVEITLKYVTNENYKSADYQHFILENSISLVKVGNNPIGEMNYQKWKYIYVELQQADLLENEFFIDDFFTTAFLRNSL